MERSNEVNVQEDVVGFVPNTDTGSKLGSGMVSLIFYFFLMYTWSQVGSLLSPSTLVVTELTSPFLPGDYFELYSTYMDIEQSGI